MAIEHYYGQLDHELRQMIEGEIRSETMAMHDKVASLPVSEASVHMARDADIKKAARKHASAFLRDIGVKGEDAEEMLSGYLVKYAKSNLSEAVISEGRRTKLLKKAKHPGRGGPNSPSESGGGDVWFYMGHDGKYKGRFEVTVAHGFLKYAVIDHLTGDSAGQPSLGEIEWWIDQSIEENPKTFSGKWDNSYA
jgi:hypothetical protein